MSERRAEPHGPIAIHLLELAEGYARLAEVVWYRARKAVGRGVVVAQNVNGCCHGWSCACASET